LTNIDCVFCKIVAGDIPADKLYQDEWVTAFRDIHPVTPTHILIIPNKHLASTNELAAKDAAIAGRMLTVVPELARAEGIAESGYRLIMNTGDHGRQEVQHMHMHLLGGRKMQNGLG
jgi:histidine triad (HIT) family protein